MNQRLLSHAVTVLGLAFALALTGCGGSKDEEAAAPPAAQPQPTPVAGSATVGGPAQADTITIAGANAAQVSVPPGALGETATLRLAADSTGSPTLPQGTEPAGAMLALTPHGTQFAKPVRVRVPAAGVAPANTRLMVMKASPGGEWHLLEPVEANDRFAEVEVTSFSFFLPVWIPIRSGTANLAPAMVIRSLSPLNDFSQHPSSPTLGRGSLTLNQPQDQVFGVTLINAPPCTDPSGWRVFATVEHITEQIGPDFNSSPIRSRILSRSGILSTAPANANGEVQLRIPFSTLQAANGFANPTWQDHTNLWRKDYFFINQWRAVCFPNGVGVGILYPAAPQITGVSVGVQTGSQTLAIARQPANAQVTAGQDAAFSVDVFGAGAGSGVPRVRVEWLRQDPGSSAFRAVGFTYSVDQPGTTHTLRLPAANTADNGSVYRAVACVMGGTSEVGQCSESATATLTVVATSTPITFSQQPRSMMVLNGQTATFTANATGLPMPDVAWQTRPANSTGAWTPVVAGAIQGGANSSFTTTPLTLADNGTQFRARAFASGNEEFSAPVTVSVSDAPVAPQFTLQPSAIRTVSGGDATLAVAVRGTEPLSYQWRVNGSVVLGENASAITLQGVRGTAAVSVEVSNGAGSITSREVSVTPFDGPIPGSPLTIMVNPVATTVGVGHTATLAVQAQGRGTLRYQWVRGGAAVPGAADAPILTFPNASAADAGNYQVIVSNDAGETARSAEVALVVSANGSTATPPAITVQPVGLSAQPGQTAFFAVGASGSGTLSYQWYREGVAISGATQPVLTLAALASADAGNYSVTVGNAQGTVSSNNAGLVVLPAPGAPQFTLQTFLESAVVGESPRLLFAVAGTPTPQCLWLRNGALIPGATDCTGYTVTNATLADNGAVFTVVAYNTAGAVVGGPAVLTVAAPVPPSITTQPQDQNITEGGIARFNAVVNGLPAPSREWSINGTAIPVAYLVGFTLGNCTFGYDVTQAVLTLYNVPLSCNGTTFVLTSRNAYGTAVSNAVTLTVTPAVPTNALTATQLVAGQEWSMVLRPDRTVWAWGRMHRTDGTVQYSNLLAANQALRPVRMYPAELSDIRAISGWFNAFWALKGEPGTTGSRVLHWGRADAGSDGRGSDGNGSLGGIGNPGGQIAPRNNEAAPVEVLERVGNGAQPVDRVCAIAGGGEQLAMIRAISSTGTTTDCNAGSAKTVWFVGSLLARGYDSTGVAFAMPGLPADSPPATIFTGKTTSGSPPLVIALEDGRLYGLGNSPYGGLGVAANGSGIVGDLLGPLQLPTTWGSPSSFGMSFYYSLFVVRADGSVMTSGYDNTGELGLGSVIGGSTLGPRPVLAETCTSLPCSDQLTGTTALVATQTGATLALKNGQILAWGARESNGLRGPGVTAHQPFPRSLPSTVTGFTALSASHAHALVIGPGNVVYAWGSGLRGALGDGLDSPTERTAPEMVTVP